MTDTKLRWLTLLLLTVALYPVLAREVKGQELSEKDRRLHVAIVGFEFNEAAAKDALADGANINAVNGAMNGETMLIHAIKGFKEPQVIKFLLDNGADPNIKDESGRTALSWAKQYDIGRNRSGKEILRMLEEATGQTKAADTEKTAPETKTAAANKTTAAKNTTTAKSTTAKTTQPIRRDGSPSADEVKAMIEKKMTSIYEDHFGGTQKAKVEFEWLAPIQIGGQETRGRIPRKCWAVKLDVKVTFTHPGSGETSWARRGVEGNPVKEMFCLFKDGFGEWDYLTYLL